MMIENAEKLVMLVFGILSLFFLILNLAEKWDERKPRRKRHN